MKKKLKKNESTKKKYKIEIWREKTIQTDIEEAEEGEGTDAHETEVSTEGKPRKHYYTESKKRERERDKNYA